MSFHFNVEVGEQKTTVTVEACKLIGLGLVKFLQLAKKFFSNVGFQVCRVQGVDHRNWGRL